MTIKRANVGSSADEFVDEMFARNPALQAEYDRLAPRWDVIAEIVRARNREGLTQRELAERMGVSQSVVARLLSGQHSPRIDTIASAAHAMGYDLEVRFVKRRASARRVAEPPEGYAAKATKKRGG
ncbi:MAG: helix-turn-helix transcriptional regulator [Chloroflexi bacterium]|nr:helix-turn-helix transcriptional regulator [Chloroflexota bacterium]MDA1240678.1 helix-turn-helix transcriptional regulator [Chloroflexota bacterium]